MNEKFMLGRITNEDLPSWKCIPYIAGRDYHTVYIYLEQSIETTEGSCI